MRTDAHARRRVGVCARVSGVTYIRMIDRATVGTISPSSKPERATS